VRFIKSAIAFFFLAVFLVPAGLSAQTPEPECTPRDLGDVVRKAMNKPLVVKEEKKSSLLIIPIIGSNPATGFMIGVGGQYAFKMPESKKYSMLMGSMSVTTKKQFVFQMKNNIYSKKDKFFLTGDWRFQIFSQSTYGLGTDAPEGGILDFQYAAAGLELGDDSLAQPMKFNFIRFHQSIGLKVKPGVYLGLGYFFDGYFNIRDEKLKLDPSDTLLTSHYVYSKGYGFDPEEYFSSALHATITIDKRDNMIQAYKGYFFQASIRGAFKFMGSDKNGSLFNTEWRSFHGVSKRNPAHLIAFWLIGEFAPEGQFPYLILPATSYDQRNRSARGYTQGRFRGNSYLYAESEYRFPISPCGGVLSGVVFVNATTASNPSTSLGLMESVKPGYGMGLRVMLDKKSRSNLSLDWGFGNRSSGFYLAVSETF
jgi:hypothetical protein